VLEGEIWFFVEDRGFHCKQGDFQRVPANKTHWAWNRSQQSATVAEAHAPALIGGRSAEGAVGLSTMARRRRFAVPARTST
jgi:quercetin dioxygenase-like cupin family protein